MSAFKLLANRRIAVILERLAAAPATAAALRDELGDVALSTVYGDMRLLEATNAAGRVAEQAPIHWEILPAGRQLRSLGHVTWFVVARLLPPRLCRTARWQEATMARLADERTTSIVRMLLVRGELRAAEIERALGPRVTHRGLYERLGYLVENGAVQRVTTPSGARRRAFRLDPSWHALGGVFVLAARWEWQVGRPADAAAASDVTSLVAVAAPSARLRAGRSGICTLAVATSATTFDTVHVWLGRRTITVVDLVDPNLAQAAVTGSPLAWCDALIRGRPVGLQVDGCTELAGRAVAVLSEATVGGLARMLRRPS